MNFLVFKAKATKKVKRIQKKSRFSSCVILVKLNWLEVQKKKADKNGNPPKKLGINGNIIGEHWYNLLQHSKQILHGLNPGGKKKNKIKNLSFKGRIGSFCA